MELNVRDIVATNRVVDSNTVRDEVVFEQLFNDSENFTAIINNAGEITNVNDRFARWLKTTSNKLVGVNFLRAIEISGNRVFTEDFTRVSTEMFSVFHGDKRKVCSEGRLITDVGLMWVSYEFSRHYDPYTQCAYFVFSARDITDLKEAKDQLEYLKRFDPITRFPMLEELFVEVKRLSKSQRDMEDKGFSLLFMSLDDFDRAEASMGKAFSDRLLRNVSIRLSNLKPRFNFLSNIDSHSFGILMSGGQEEGERTIKQILDALKEPFFIGNDSICVTASFGLVNVGNGLCKPERLLRAGREAMENAKERGVEFHATSYLSRDSERENTFMIISDLKQAIESEDLSLRFQPIVDFETMKMVAVETLLRWEHPKLGSITPSKFIPIAESTRLMPKIEKWIIDKTFKQLAEWQKIHPELSDFRLSINISPAGFGTDFLVKELTNALAKYSIDPKNVILEITESQTIERFGNTFKVLAELDKMGFAIALDDFGTGYSSLNYLTTLPISVVKIDKSFVTRNAGSDACSRILEAIVELSKTLCIRSVAEGIETDEQFEYLKELGCQYGQGFMLMKPATGNTITELLSERGGKPGLTALQKGA